MKKKSEAPGKVLDICARFFNHSGSRPLGESGYPWARLLLLRKGVVVEVTTTLPEASPFPAFTFCPLPFSTRPELRCQENLHLALLTFFVSASITPRNLVRDPTLMPATYLADLLGGVFHAGNPRSTAGGPPRPHNRPDGQRRPREGAPGPGRSCPCEASGTVSHRLRGVSREKLRTSYRFKNKFRTRID